VTEVARYAQAHPDADLGLHLTLNSEWETYRWGSVAPHDQVPSLHDADGTFPRTTDTVAKQAKPADVERELRAQIDRAYAMGIKPTHVDSHMGALHDDAELRAMTVGWDAWGAKWRQQDYDVLTSAEFKQALKDNGVVLVTWRDVQKAMYPTP
jgi:predicted glycoside hydrolase/deacetylase ChbG (UPF0249 family)